MAFADLPNLESAVCGSLHGYFRLELLVNNTLIVLLHEYIDSVHHLQSFFILMATAEMDRQKLRRERESEPHFTDKETEAYREPRSQQSQSSNTVLQILQSILYTQHITWKIGGALRMVERRNELF